jgi:hypothetical protein
MEVDGTDGFAIQARIEELLRILHLGAFGECQPHGVLERICYAYVSIMKPDWKVFSISLPRPAQGRPP